MNLNIDDTISAIATPMGAGGIGIIRISGTNSMDILSNIFLPIDKKDFTHALMRPGYIVDPKTNNKLDFVLAVWFKSPHSFTGEDVVEIHAHGGRLNLEQILNLCLSMDARIAEPGEFTLRAFLNGKLDLTKAEAVREVIESQTDAALTSSRRHLEGDVTALCMSTRNSILHILSHIEALIDFPEEDLTQDETHTYLATLEDIESKLKKTAETFKRGRLLHEGVEIMIIGLPNVGKSSLLNKLLGVDRAIVTEIPGTTRDLIEARTEISGVPVRLIDSAGLNDKAEEIEAIGIKLAKERIEKADIIIWVLDSSRDIIDRELEIKNHIDGKNVILAINKNDLPDSKNFILNDVLSDFPMASISAKSGQGIDKLKEQVSEFLLEDTAESDTVILTSARQHSAFAKSSEALLRSLGEIREHSGQYELIATDLREALEELDSILGIGTPDDVLNEIFSKFCIGK